MHHSKPAAQDRCLQLSSYADSLQAEAKIRYRQKISVLDGYDPFLGVPAGARTVLLPVESSDLVSSLVLETSFLPAKLFKERKGHEAFNQFVSG